MNAKNQNEWQNRLRKQLYEALDDARELEAEIAFHASKVSEYRVQLAMHRLLVKALQQLLEDASDEPP